MNMKTRLIIRESQLEYLKKTIQESLVYSRMVERIKKDLDLNYAASIGVVREGGEYFEKPMIKILIDGEMITPKALYEYLKFKYKMGDDFTKQIIQDWVFGKITDDYRLSKNVALN